MTTEAADKTKELEAAIAEVAAADETVAPEQNDLAKALGAAIDRLELLAKGDFGSTEKAHNGNSADKSAPTGNGKPAGGYASADAEANPDNAKERVSRSQDVHQSVKAPATTLNKGDVDEEDDEDEDEDEKKKKEAAEAMAFKSQASTSEDKIFKNLTTGEGSDEYMQVVEASDAIAHQAEVFAKAIAAVSTQVAELSKEFHSRIDRLEKSQGALVEGATTLLKSQAQLVKDSEVLKKAPVAGPSSGIVIVAPKGEAVKAPQGQLAKSIAAAMQNGKVEVEIGARLLAKLSTQTPDQVWESLSAPLKEAIGGGN